MLESGLLQGRRRPLRAGRPAAPAGDPGDAAGLAAGAARPAGAGQGGGADRRLHRPGVLLRAAGGGGRAAARGALRQALADWSRPGWSSATARRRTRRYTFKHALVQEAAYRSLLRSRRQQLHARIAARDRGAVSGGRGRAAGAARPPLHAGGSGRTGGRLLAEGGASWRSRVPPWRKRSPISRRAWTCWASCPTPSTAGGASSSCRSPSVRRSRGRRATHRSRAERAWRRARELCDVLGGARSAPPRAPGAMLGLCGTRRIRPHARDRRGAGAPRRSARRHDVSDRRPSRHRNIVVSFGGVDLFPPTSRAGARHP